MAYSSNYLKANDPGSQGRIFTFGGGKAVVSVPYALTGG